MKRRPCPICGTEFQSPFKTCSLACGYELRKQTVRPRPCPTCGTSFRPYLSTLMRKSGHYCSRACYLAVINRRPALIEAACARCGSKFRRTRAAIARVRQTYCSSACATADHTGAGSANWRGGSDPNRGQGWRRLAEQIRERDQYRCRRCGKSQEEAGQRLSVDHVIPWRAFTSETEANEPSNLVALCRVCHSRKGRAERKWLLGDVLEMWDYQVAVSQPWTAAS